MPIIKCQCGTDCGKTLKIETISDDISRVVVAKHEKVILSLASTNNQVAKFIFELLAMLRGEEFNADEQRRWNDGGHNQATDKN